MGRNRSLSKIHLSGSRATPTQLAELHAALRPSQKMALAHDAFSDALRPDLQLTPAHGVGYGGSYSGGYGPAGGYGGGTAM